ncbi:MAG: hypothetical protein INF43_01200 [Alphaproteobacteria bacterium]|nr:hypothetical protein [Alphaproteobacteria bacterium]
MALRRSTKLILLGGAAVALLITLGLSVQESRTIVVSAKPTTVPSATSATVVGQLANPRYTGQNAQGLWQVTAANATQQATGSHSGAHTGGISLTDVAARWEPEQAPPLALQAPLASFTPSDSRLILPQGVAATGSTGPYHILLTAAAAQASLPESQLRLSGGVSVTLTPR